MTFSAKYKHAIKTGLIGELYQRGLLSSTHTLYYEIFAARVATNASYRELANSFNTTHTTVARAINTFR
jgi:hypothetical protein